MSEQGVFAMDRGWFDHPAFASEPYTEREAWAWLISSAAYSPYRRRVGHVPVSLKRGQLTASVRFIAEKWQWHRSRVDRFLQRLVAESMIETDARQGVSVITIRNYNKYQTVSLPKEVAAETPPRQQRDKEEPLESQESEGGGDARARERRPLISEEAHSFAAEMAKICGHNPEFLPPQWVSAGPAMRIQMMLDAGWRVDVMRESAKAVARKRGAEPIGSIKYFEKIFARAHAPQLPLPDATMEPTHATPAANPAASDWRGRRDQQHAARAKLREFIAAHDQDGGGESGGQVVRLVPNVGRG